jgi:hypothetical protein
VPYSSGRKPIAITHSSTSAPTALCMINQARECTVLDCAATPFEPDQEALSHVAGDLELARTTRLLLNGDRTGREAEVYAHKESNAAS